MDINLIRAGVTVLGLLLFIGIVAWSWSRRRERGFEEAARLPFLDDEHHSGARR